MNKQIGMIFLTFFVLTAFLLTGCGDPGSSSKPEITIEISPTTESNPTVEQGGELILTVTLTSPDGNPGGVTWEISGNKPETGLFDTSPEDPYKRRLVVSSNENLIFLLIEVTSVRDPSKKASVNVFVIEKSEIIPEIEVSIGKPVSTMAGQGGILNFDAHVEAKAGASDDIKWTFEGNTDSNTSISALSKHTASLTIGQNETSTAITITASTTVEGSDASDSIVIMALQDVRIVLGDNQNDVLMTQNNPKNGIFNYASEITEETFSIKLAEGKWLVPAENMQDIHLGNNNVFYYQGITPNEWKLLGSGTYLITLNPSTMSMIVQKEGVDQLTTPAKPVLSNHGIATWTGIVPETDVSGYTIQLLRGGNAISNSNSIVTVNTGTYTHNFLSVMREDVGVYTVRVIANGNNETSADSEHSPASDPQTISRRQNVTVVNWSGDTAVWTAVPGNNSLGYKLILYRNSTQTAEYLTMNTEYNLTNAIENFGFGTYTFTVTALGDEYLLLDAAESVRSGENAKHSPTTLDPPIPTFSNEGAAAWTYTEAVDFKEYSLQLYKAETTESTFSPLGSAVTVPKGTKTHSFLTVMQNSGVGVYRYTIVAVHNTNASLNSPAETSGVRSVTRRNPVTNVRWNESTNNVNENGLVYWNNPDGGLNSGGAPAPLFDYSVQVYKHVSGSKVKVGEPIDAKRNNQEGDVTWTAWHLAIEGIPADIRYEHSVEIIAKGGGVLEFDSEPAESPKIFYTVFGNSTVWTIVQGGANQFAAGADGGRIAYSTDGQIWTLSSQSGFDNDSIRAIAYGNGIFVAVGHNGKISRSTNGGQTWTGVNWQAGSGNIGGAYLTASYGGGLFVIGGDGGEIRVSTDNTGSTWRHITKWDDSPTASSLFIGNTVKTIMHDGTRFVAFSEIGRNAYSTDGIEWTYISNNLNQGTVHEVGTRNILNGAVGGTTFVFALGGETWLPLGDFNQITSRSYTWKEHKLVNPYNPSSSALIAVFYGNGKFIGVGDNGGISISIDNGENWTHIQGKPLTPPEINPNTGYDRENKITAAMGLSGNRILLSGNEYTGGWGKMSIIEIP